MFSSGHLVRSVGKRKHQLIGSFEWGNEFSGAMYVAVGTGIWLVVLEWSFGHWHM